MKTVRDWQAEGADRTDTVDRDGKRAKALRTTHFDGKTKLNNKTHYRGVAQMVACLFRVQEAMGSNPVTPTKEQKYQRKLVFLFFR